MHPMSTGMELPTTSEIRNSNLQVAPKTCWKREKVWRVLWEHKEAHFWRST